MTLDRNQIYLFLNTLNSVEGYYRHKKNKNKNDENTEIYYRRAQKIIWGLLDELDEKNKEEF